MKMLLIRFRYLVVCLSFLMVVSSVGAKVLVTAFTEDGSNNIQPACGYNYLGYVFNMNTSQSAVITDLGRYFWNGEQYPTANNGIHEIILLRRENDQLRVIAQTTVDMTQPYDSETTVAVGTGGATNPAGFVYGQLATPLTISASDAQYGQYGIMSREISHTDGYEAFRFMDYAAQVPVINNSDTLFMAGSVSTGGMISSNSADLNVGDLIPWQGAPWIMALNLRYELVPPPQPEPANANTMITAFTEGAKDSSQIPYGYMGFAFNLKPGVSMYVSELGRYFYNGEAYPAGGANTGIHELILLRRENDQLKAIAETLVDMTKPYDHETTTTVGTDGTINAAGFVYGKLATPLRISADDAQYGQYVIMSREVSHTGPWEFFRCMNYSSQLPVLGSQFEPNSVAGQLSYTGSPDVNVGDVIGFPGNSPWPLALNMRYYDTVVDMNSLALMAAEWLDCTMPGGLGCIPPQEVSLVIPQGTVTVDGDLSEWASASWIPLNKGYYQSATDISEAKFAAKWDIATKKIYAAVVVHDSSIFLSDTPGEWDLSDRIEVYSQGSHVGGSSYGAGGSGLFDIAQQYIIGAAVNGIDSWAVFGDNNPNVGTGYAELEKAVVVDDANGIIVYEIGVKQYDNYGVIADTNTVVTDMQPGMIVGFDIVVSSRYGDYQEAPWDFGQLAENTLGNKYLDASQFASYELGGTGCGGWGYSESDISGPAGSPDCIVDFCDFAAMASDWLQRRLF